MIRVANLTKTFGAVHAVENLTFEVKPGVVTGFLGPNGAGKSTTMRMIVGLDRPTSGSATINGKPYTAFSEPLREVGTLLDAKWVHPNRSARAHLRWMAASNGIPASRVDKVLSDVGLTEVAGRKAGGFSLGMSQRLGLAGALLGDPGVLLFDEPVNGLDPEGIVWIRNFIKGLAAQGRTVLVSSHLLTEMSLTASHLVVIGRGKLLADTSVDEFIGRTNEAVVRVRGPQMAQMWDALSAARLSIAPAEGAGPPTIVVKNATTEQVGDVLGTSSIVIHELSEQRASLEEAFMQLTGQSVEFHGDPGMGNAGLGNPGAMPQPGFGGPQGGIR